MRDNKMEFPETFDEFAGYYGFKDTEEIYTNGSDLIPIFRVKQWLEQNHILDKIRAEIMELDYDTENVDYDYNDMAQTEEVHIICREEVLQIIDKYKAESEDKE